MARRARPLPAGVLARLLLAMAVALTAGCGIARDDAPRPIDRAAIPELRPTTTTPVLPEGPDEVVLYFPAISGEALIPVVRSAPRSLEPEAILAQLISGPTEEEREELNVTTSIPAGTALRGVEREGDLLIIDLNEGIESVEGPGLITAYAQLVWTATAIDADPRITRVAFRVDGEIRPGASDAGPQDVLSTRDFRGPNRPPG